VTLSLAASASQAWSGLATCPLSVPHLNYRTHCLGNHVTPQGHWQPPERFESTVRFARVAAAVRAAKAAGSYAGPLAGKLVYVHCQATPHAPGGGGASSSRIAGGGGGAAAGGAPQGATSFSSHAAATEHRVFMQRLVRALGGRVCGARAADVCVMCGSTAVPLELPGSAAAVREDWLLHVAETHESADELQAFEVPRRQQRQQQRQAGGR
jgi:hypothetical protein